MSLKNKRIFVSGGAGVIGLEMIPRLLEYGAIVMVGDIKPRPASFPASLIYHQGDLNFLSKEEVQIFQPEIFIHLAASFERSEESYDFWEENFWHNVRLSHYLMDILKDQESLKRVVFASSYLIYDPALYQFNFPQAEAFALKETDPILPRNLIGMAKLCHEIELRFLNQFKSKNFKTVCARIYRGFGKNSRDIISRWVRAILIGSEIQVYRPEGMFDYIYAADSAEGLIQLAKNDSLHGIVNLGTGKAHKVIEVVSILQKYFPDMRFKEINSDIPFEASVADMSLFSSKIDWIPFYSLERAIHEIISHEKSASLIPKDDFKFNILISSSSKKIPLIKAVQKATKKINGTIKVIAGDMNSEAISFFMADDFWIMPEATEKNLSSIIEGCILREIRLIFPSRDGELLFWASNYLQFKNAGIEVVISEYNSVQTCIDKLTFSVFGKNHNLPFIDSSEDPKLLNAARFVVKERYGAGSRNIGLNLGLNDAIIFSKNLKSPIFQKFIKGYEISADAWIDNKNKVKGLVLRYRNQVDNGESQVTTTFRDILLENTILNILEILKLRGPVVLQAIISENKLFVIECNTRFGGASTASIAVGLDSFYWSCMEVINHEVDNIPFKRDFRDVRQVRTANDSYFFI